MGDYIAFKDEDELYHYGRKGMKKGMNIFNPDYKPKGEKANTSLKTAANASKMMRNQRVRKDAREKAKQILESKARAEAARNVQLEAAKRQTSRVENARNVQLEAAKRQANPEGYRMVEKRKAKREQKRLSTPPTQLEQNAARKEMAKKNEKPTSKTKDNRSNAQKASDKAVNVLKQQANKKKIRDKEANIEKGRERADFAKKFNAEKAQASTDRYLASKNQRAYNRKRKRLNNQQ